MLTIDKVLQTHRHGLFVGYRDHLAYRAQLNVNLQVGVLFTTAEMKP